MADYWDQFEDVKPSDGDFWSQFEDVKPEPAGRGEPIAADIMRDATNSYYFGLPKYAEAALKTGAQAVAAPIADMFTDSKEIDAERGRSLWQNYKRNLGEIQGEQAAFRREHPGTAIAANLVGAFSPGSAAGKVGKLAAKPVEMITRGGIPGYLARVGVSGATGAAQGAAAGAMEDLLNTTDSDDIFSPTIGKSAGTGAKLGGGIGAAIPAVTPAFRAVGAAFGRAGRRGAPVAASEGGIPLSAGQASGRPSQIAFEEAALKGQYGEGAQNAPLRFADKQRQAARAALESIGGSVDDAVGPIERVREKIAAGYKASKAEVDRAYEALRKLEAEAPAGFSGDYVRDLAARMRDDLTAMGYKPDLQRVDRIRLPSDIIKDVEKLAAKASSGGNPAPAAPETAIRHRLGQRPDDYLPTLKAIRRNLEKADPGFRMRLAEDGRGIDYGHFLKDPMRRDYIGTLPSTMKRPDITATQPNKDGQIMDYFLKKYINPSSGRDVYDFAVKNPGIGRLQTKFAREGKYGQRYANKLFGDGHIQQAPAEGYRPGLAGNAPNPLSAPSIPPSGPPVNPPVSITDLEAVRSGISANMADPNVPRQVKAYLGTILNGLDAAMAGANNEALVGSPATLEAMKHARGLRAAMGRRFENGKAVETLLDEAQTPEKLAQSIFGSGPGGVASSGRAVSEIVKAAGKDAPAVKNNLSASLLSKVYDASSTNGELSLAKLETSLSRLLKNRSMTEAVFANPVIKRLESILKAARMLKDKPPGTVNNSNTFVALSKAVNNLPFVPSIRALTTDPMAALRAREAFGEIGPQLPSIWAYPAIQALSRAGLLKDNGRE